MGVEPAGWAGEEPQKGEEREEAREEVGHIELLAARSRTAVIAGGPGRRLY